MQTDFSRRVASLEAGNKAMRQLMTEHKSAADSAPLSLSFRVAELEEVRGMSNTLASAQTSTVAELNSQRNARHPPGPGGINARRSPPARGARGQHAWVSQVDHR